MTTTVTMTRIKRKRRKRRKKQRRIKRARKCLMTLKGRNVPLGPLKRKIHKFKVIEIQK